MLYKQVPAQLTLVHSNNSSYIILIPEEATDLENRAAEVLQQYFLKVSQATLAIVRENEEWRNKNKNKKENVISIGETSYALEDEMELPSEGYSVKQKNQVLLFQGKGKGILYGVYSFIEEILGARKWYSKEEATYSPLSEVILPKEYSLLEWPAFQYREVYFPVEEDQEYVDWHKIHKLDDLWGLWGHTFDRLVPSKTYFTSHPEYFSLFNGKRQANQLCLSNPDVLSISVEAIRTALSENPDATFWSISPNDDLGYCECDHCREIDELEGGPQGSLLNFVNKIAAQFPQQQFTTLAYTYSAWPTKRTQALENVTVFLSNIEAQRTHSVAEGKSARAFRLQLEGWRKKANQLFIWDYYTQFTSYLAPFPDIPTIQKNLRFYQEQGVKGVFAQGSGDTYSEFSELKSYLLAKLLWNPSLDVDSLRNEFLEGYYGRAAKQVKQYLDLLYQNSRQEVLDIYGNPINHHSGYLSLSNMNDYSSLMDKAEGQVEGKLELEKRIERLRLSQEYVYLQQARFYGIEPHGVFSKNNKGVWEINEVVKRKVKSFTKAAEENGIKELSEGGLTPQEYQQEWEHIFTKGVRDNLALNARIFDTKNDFDSSFPAKGWRTLVDGTSGYNDFSYNWLCFYGKEMEFTMDLGKQVSMEQITINFLEDARHWIFAPKSVTVWVSEDGKEFQEIERKYFKTEEENYKIGRAQVKITHPLENIRFVKVNAAPLDNLPAFRFHKHKSPMIACDEVWIQ